MMGWIYIFFNLINHKVYIGKWQGKRVETRRDEHKKGRGSPLLYADIIEYGWENFIFDTLHENVPIEMLDYLERKEIARFDCNECAGGWGYNQTKGGGGVTVHTPEAIQKMLEAQRKRVTDGTHHFLGENNPSHKRIADGTHPFLGENNPSHKRIADGTHPFLDSEFQRKLHEINSEAQRKRVTDGTHPFLDSEFQRKVSERNRKRVADGTHPFLDSEAASEKNRKRVADGTHPFLDSEAASKRAHKRVADGTHPFLRENSPRAYSEYIQARWEFFLSYPLGIKAARKQLYEKFDNVPRDTIRYWVRKWKGEMGAV